MRIASLGRTTRAGRERLLAGLVVLVALPWLVVPPPAHAIAGIEGTFEYAIDGPWRMEPGMLPGGRLAYGAIPIQISIHDANNVGRDREGVSDPQQIALGRVCEVVVHERRPGDAAGEPPTGPTTTLLSSRFDEIEYTRGRWPAPGEPFQDAPEHALCRAWKGEDCTGFDRVGGSSEWHASFGYRPSRVRPATAVSLQVEVHLTKDPLSSCEIVPDYNHVRLINELSVYYAPAPLPRFGKDWLYGDLHYHSQGTDNEGESAYNYRGVIRAMGALGMDFAFATEHASNSQQVVDIDTVIGNITHPHETRSGLRDMSSARFGFLRDLLHGPGGANPESALLMGLAGRTGLRRTVPQIFLGGEVDLIPELAPGTQYGDVLPWGNGQQWSTENLCFGNVVDFGGPFTIGCATLGIHLLEQTATDPDGVLVDDVQGFSADFARHHIIYLPRRAQDTGAFVRSDTGPYGGAHRRFKALRPELEQHGYFFAAHSFSYFQRGGVVPSLGPDDLPWSDHLYEQVWRSPAWLGLQFWNEDARLQEAVPPWDAFTTTDAVPSPDYCVLLGPNPVGQLFYICPKPGGDVGYERPDSPIVFVPPAYLPVDRPQAGFGTGLFHLDVEAPVTRRWSEPVFGVEEKLHHGAFTWDRLNHWGLDLRKTKDLDWLPSILSPRRLFMAGGSDAHGDLNYRRTGYLRRTEAINNAALGKPRNLVEAGAPGDRTRGGATAAAAAPIAVQSQIQVVTRIADGRFSVTDGPALRIAIDQNANRVIDAADSTMGDVVNLHRRNTLPLLVEWKSTREFGRVMRIDLYVGARSSQVDLANSSNEHAPGRTYAPEGAGVFHPTIPGIGIPDSIVDDPPYDRMGDNYWRDPAGQLRITPVNGWAGTRRVLLDLRLFPAMDNLPADRFFVRAFAITDTADPGDLCVADHEGCLRRYAFTNPIWAIKDTYACSGEAALDQEAPTVSCNAPASIARRDIPESLTATAEDACPTVVRVSHAECGLPGQPSSQGCRVATRGDTLTLLRGSRAGVTVHWIATATDASGHAATANCQTEVTP